MPESRKDSVLSGMTAQFAGGVIIRKSSSQAATLMCRALSGRLHPQSEFRRQRGPRLKPQSRQPAIRRFSEQSQKNQTDRQNAPRITT